MRLLFRRLSVPIVLGLEAAGAILIHDSVSSPIVTALVVVGIAATAWFLDTGIDAGVKRWDSWANGFGARLGSGAKIHGYWYTAVYDGTDRGLLGGSVVRIRATVDEFLFEGEAYIFSTGAWTKWTGSGSPYDKRGIVYGYEGRENGRWDNGFGLYTFATGENPKTVNGNFYGRELPANNYRFVYGERCDKPTRQFRTDSEVRRSLFREFLDDERTAPAVSSPPIPEP
jgi:hypothetical protein